MKTSCGILIINNNGEILLGHVTGQKHYDIPKGIMDEGETYLECAIRECKEETSLVFTEDDLTELGMFPYNKKKQLYLFLAMSKYVSIDIDIEKLTCVSLFEHFYTKEMLPEIDSFIWAKFSDIGNYCTKDMTNTLNSCVTVVTVEN